LERIWAQAVVEVERRGTPLIELTKQRGRIIVLKVMRKNETVRKIDNPRAYD
jgi:hypothetical protein